MYVLIAFEMYLCTISTATPNINLLDEDKVPLNLAETHSFLGLILFTSAASKKILYLYYTPMLI